MSPADGRRTLRLTIEYDGTEYGGWQSQANADTIQDRLRDALEQVCDDRDVDLHGAGRTDAGVHALGQAAHLRTVSETEPRGILRGANSLLPRDIRVIAARDVEPDFHARYDALGKTYRYRILSRDVASAVRGRFTMHVRDALDTDAMARAAASLVGRRDFRAFQAHADPDAPADDTVRTLHRLEVLRPASLPDEVWLEADGDGFLHHMVRNLAGTLLEVGRGRQPDDWPAEVLAGRDRAAGGPTAAACGLALVRVRYPGDADGVDETDEAADADSPAPRAEARP